MPLIEGAWLTKSWNADYIARRRRCRITIGGRRWINESERDDFIRENGLRFLREYQVNAIRSIQRAVKGWQGPFSF